ACSAASESSAPTSTAGRWCPSCPSPSSRARRSSAPTTAAATHRPSEAAGRGQAMTAATASDDAPFAGRGNPALYLAVALVAGAVIVLQIGLMRVFAVGSWSHFGSLVVSLAMLGFGLASVIMCIANDWFVRHWRAVAGVSLLACGPLMAASTLLAQ